MNRFFNVHPKSDDKSEMEGEGLKQMGIHSVLSTTQ